MMTVKNALPNFKNALPKRIFKPQTNRIETQLYETQPLSEPTRKTQETITKKSTRSDQNASELTSRTVEIVKGDTLGKLSIKYKVSVDAIREANRLKGDTIYPGQRLIVPNEAQPPPQEPITKDQNVSESSQRTIEVVEGDTLWELFIKYGVSIDAIKKANGLTEDTIYAGDRLIIP